GDGVEASCSDPIVIGQIQVLEVPHPEAAQKAILAAKEELLDKANEGHPHLIEAGGGAIDVEVHDLPKSGPDDPCGEMLVVHLIVDVRDAMGANAINSMCERLAPRITELTQGRVGLRILSNLTDRRTVTVRGKVPFSALEGRGKQTPDELARGIVEASVFAERDPYRAATHNKGIMNGIDSVLVAFGQDWRAVEAGAHAYAARDGRYTALARWRVEGEALVGEMTVPMAVGTVGGVANVHPTVQVTRRLAGIEDASELAGVIAAVGLAQNLSALRALAAEGIQKGHMRLHARNVAVEAGATGDAIDEVARRIAEDGQVNLSAAKEVLAGIEARREEASKIPSIYSKGGEGVLLHHFAELRDAYWPRIQALLDEMTASTTPEASNLVPMCSYHMETGGKRLRALLPLLVAEALECERDLALPLGAACEMLHNATLVHDDLQDGDLVRRGRMTVWNRFGIPQAINLGDAMFYWSVLLCQRIEATPKMREALSRRLLVDTLRVIDGQEREFLLMEQPEAGLADYFRMVEGKTSGLFALPMAGAAELCGAEPQLVEGLAESARHMGVLFQIQDDTLDLYGDKGRDQVGSDIAEGKRSALVMHAFEQLEAASRDRLRAILDTDRKATTPAMIDEALALLEQAGALEFALNEIRSRKERAMQVPSVRAHERLSTLVAGMCDLFLKPIAPLLNA
ncbi:MAG: hydroxymethylglutaryl-CoA reductase, degradative, partial [Myxococcales bacterium]|nr:hydroxymethylglutaryl-CoA reductase, degradative [Myxococcales bacterium]